MVDKRQMAVAVVVALVGIGVVGWLLFAFVGAITQANPSTQAAIIAGLVALFSVVFTFWKERSRSIKEAHRDKKIEIYSQFFDLMFALLERQKLGETAEGEVDTELVKSLSQVSQGVLFYGSPSVVIAFSDFRMNTAREGVSGFEVTLRNIGRILLTMREDIGLSNRGLDEISIHQIYVSEDLRTLVAGKAL